MSFSPNIIFDIVAFLFAISVHESAHAWSASLCGDQTARLLGRVTLNPIKHIDPMGTIVFPLIAALTNLPMFGWAKPTPVDPRQLRHPRRDDIIVSAAGPASNFAVALAAVILLTFIGRMIPGGADVVVGAVSGHADSSVLAAVCMLLFRFLLINVILGVFNLIPIPPLDGSHILVNLLPPGLARMYAEVGRFGFVLLILLLMTDVPIMLIRPVIGLFLSLLRL